MDLSYLLFSTRAGGISATLADIIEAEIGEVGGGILRQFDDRFDTAYDSGLVYLLPIRHRRRVVHIIEDFLRVRAEYIATGKLGKFRNINYHIDNTDGDIVYESDDEDNDEDNDDYIGDDGFPRGFPSDTPFEIAGIEPALITVNENGINLRCDGKRFGLMLGALPVASLLSIDHLLPAGNVSLELNLCVIDPREVSEFLNNCKCPVALTIGYVKVDDEAESNVIDCNNLRSVRIDLSKRMSGVDIDHRRHLVFAPMPSVRNVELVGFSALSALSAISAPVSAGIEIDIAKSFPNAVVQSISESPRKSRVEKC